MFNYLFTPIKIGKMEVKNRIVLPPMTLGIGGPAGMLTERHCDYYEARAKGGAGLIITEGTGINPKRTYGLFPLGLYDDSLIPSWNQLAKAVHKYGAKVMSQLFDPGPEIIKMLTGIDPVGPSAVAGWGMFRDVPKELTIDEIEAIINDFGDAARRAKEAGLDGVQIHAAHGYAMVGSFLSPFFNKRTDGYGGSLEDRMKFLLEIIKSVRKKAGEDFPVIVRMSGDERRTGGRTVHETQFIAGMLEKAGVDALEISGGTVPNVFWGVVAPSGTPLALNTGFSESIKKVVDIPVISVGRINTPRIAEFVLENGKADMVSMGRALNADPELPNKAANGWLEDIAPCVACNIGCIGTVVQAGAASCTVNPAAGREREMEIIPAQKLKNVMIIGGGPAGLEAARVAAIRGHKVTLFEKENKLGGQINIASVPPFMQEISQLIKYLSGQAKKAGVKVELGKEVTAAFVKERKPDVVIVATGAVPARPDSISGVDKGNVVSAWETLAGHRSSTAKKVIILGGGVLGCETADFLAQTNDNFATASADVTIIEKMDILALDCVAEQRHLLMGRLREKRVNILLGAEVNEILDDGVVYTKDGKKEAIKGAEFVILAVGVKPNNMLSNEIKDIVSEVYVIGDANTPKKALQATAAGAEIARKI